MVSRITPLQKRQLSAFAVTWLAYASTYLLRKPLGVIKTDLQHEFSFTELQLGWLDTALMLPYATMQVFLAPLADRHGTRMTLAVCLACSALSMIGFGEANNFYIFGILLFLNGLAQAITWPSSVKALGLWYPQRSLNSVMGVFGTSAFVGGIAGTALAVYFQHFCSWRAVYFFAAIIVLIIGLLVYLTMYSPAELNITVPDRPSEEVMLLENKVPKPTVIQLWKIKSVPEIAVAMFCIKAVRYSMYMWLPLYLLDESNYTKSQAGLFSTCFEIGGVMGSVIIGFIVDRFFKGFTLTGTTLSVALSMITVIAFFVTNQWGFLFNTAFLTLAGAFNCGPDTMLSSSVPMEIGESLGHGSGSAVVGLVNGFGSIGTFLEGPILGLIIQHYKWDGMATTLVFLSAVGSLCCWRASRLRATSSIGSDSSFIST